MIDEGIFHPFNLYCNMDNYKTILVVDDEVFNVRTIAGYLEQLKMPIKVLEAGGGEEALNIARESLPDLVITDWDMPGTDGIALIRALKEGETTKEIPVIMFTGVMTTAENLETALQAGAVDYIRKPIDKIELKARVNSTLRLSESYKEIKILNKAKDKVFSIISHDLKGPVLNMQALTEMLLEQLEKSDMGALQEMLTLMKKQSSATVNILDNLFSWAGSQRNKLLYAPQKQPVRSTVEKALELLDVRYTGRKINITNKIDHDHIANFDHMMLSMVLRNLISNAIKFTPDGGDIFLESTLKKNKLRVSIHDTGVGMTKDQIQSIFTSNQYHTTSGTKGEMGSGLGTKICQEFLALHGTTLEIESSPGKGTTCSFLLDV